MKIKNCKSCGRPFESWYGRRYCSDVCRGTVRILHCRTCERPFESTGKSPYCSDACRKLRINGTKAPAVYRFICPDGRSYVGSSYNITKRGNYGVARLNVRLAAAFKQHSPETWTFEILELLAPGCSEQELRGAEQRHIDRLHSCEPDAGFNMAPALHIRDEDAAAYRRLRRAGIVLD